MSEAGNQRDADFDPYYRWLAIPPEEQPPTLYRLLGVQPFESDPEVIAIAADRQMAHIKTFAAGKHSRSRKTCSTNWRGRGLSYCIRSERVPTTLPWLSSFAPTRRSTPMMDRSRPNSRCELRSRRCARRRVKLGRGR